MWQSPSTPSVISLPHPPFALKLFWFLKVFFLMLSHFMIKHPLLFMATCMCNHALPTPPPKKIKDETQGFGIVVNEVGWKPWSLGFKSSGDQILGDFFLSIIALVGRGRYLMEISWGVDSDTTVIPKKIKWKGLVFSCFMNWRLYLVGHVGFLELLAVAYYVLEDPSAPNGKSVYYLLPYCIVVSKHNLGAFTLCFNLGFRIDKDDL